MYPPLQKQARAEYAGLQFAKNFILLYFHRLKCSYETRFYFCSQKQRYPR